MTYLCFFPLLVARKTERGKGHAVKLCFFEKKDLEGSSEREYCGGGNNRAHFHYVKAVSDYLQAFAVVRKVSFLITVP